MDVVRARQIPRHDLPSAGDGQAIGLLGGSFNPPHAGHLHISREALKRFRLDRVWWLVSPGNPLKADGPAPMARRIAACREIADDPRILVTDIEARLGTVYTAQTLRHLFRLYPAVRFTWLMGADNLAQFHHWQEWKWIAENVPMGILARPGDRTAALHSPAARTFRDKRLPAQASRHLSCLSAPAWCFVNVPMVDLSSSQIRACGGW